ncbi:MAG: LrgB family protein [Sphaerochaetaceae bacterium]
MAQIFYTPMFGIALTLVAWCISTVIAKKVNHPLVNPVVLGGIICIIFLVVTGIPLEAYKVGGDFLVALILPAVTCIAVSVYMQLKLLKKYIIPIIVGCTVGSIFSALSVYFLSDLFGLSEVLKFSALPKSITSAFALELADLMGGIPSLAHFAVMITGTSGIMFGPFIISLLKIEDPIVQGVALGTTSHVVGAAKAFDYGQIQGAMAGIGIFVTGIATTLICLLFII